MLRRVSGRPGASRGAMETKISSKDNEKSPTHPHEKNDSYEDLPPLPLNLLTNRTLNGINAFLRGQVGLSVSVKRTSKEMCKTLLAALGYSGYDLREVNVSYVTNGCIDTPSQRGPIHPGALLIYLEHVPS